VQCALYLVIDSGGPLVLLFQGPETESPFESFSVEVACQDAERGRRVTEEIRELSVRHNVFRGQVIEFGAEVFGRAGAPMSFLDRPATRRDQVILPAEVLDGIEEQVIGIARHAGELRASGQHLKRGILLHGPPGTGKTHTIRYLLGQLPDVTVVLVSGQALERIRDACSVARTLQPAVVVVEDVDLIAEEREQGSGIGQHPLLFELLNEMDGLGADLDVTFLLRLYQGNLDLDLSGSAEIIERTDGVTASFLKELLRRAALRAAVHGAAVHGAAVQGAAAAAPAPADGAPLRVTAAHLAAALDQLLDTRNQLTRVLLGGHPGEPAAEPA
jgi:ATPase family associated with various cellular activities (AAA)